MGLKKHNPITPGLRFYTSLTTDDITKKEPEKSLTKTRKQHAGRNSLGRVTTRHRGGGHKQRLRDVDFFRRIEGVEGKIVGIEYDPTRSARIALVHYTNGIKSYIIATKNMKVDDRIVSGTGVDVSEGNAMPLSDIPLGTLVHNVELRPGGGAKVARSAGMFAQVIAKEGDYAHVRLPSGEVRLIHRNCKATIGQVGNEDHGNVSVGKAGRTRWKGIRPTVRGTVMNPCDHPHGGGEGKNKTSGRHPVSPWGVGAKGGRTRPKRKSNKFIVTSRHKKRK